MQSKTFYALLIIAVLSPLTAWAQEPLEKAPACEDPHIALSTYYASLNGGAFIDALRLHSTAGLQEWKMKGAQQFKAWAARETKDSQVKKVKLLDVIEGRKAFVSFEVLYVDGTKVMRKTTLLVEKGCWKVGSIQED